MKVWEKIGAIQSKYVLILFLVSLCEGGFITYKELTRNENGERLDNIERVLSICSLIAQAETDINTKILHNNGIELYHCNKDKRGNPKYSFVVYNGVIYSARNKASKGIWEFEDLDGSWWPIVEIKNIK